MSPSLRAQGATVQGELLGQRITVLFLMSLFYCTEVQIAIITSNPCKILLLPLLRQEIRKKKLR